MGQLQGCLVTTAQVRSHTVVGRHPGSEDNKCVQLIHVFRVGSTAAQGMGRGADDRCMGSPTLQAWILGSKAALIKCTCAVDASDRPPLSRRASAHTSRRGSRSIPHLWQLGRCSTGWGQPPDTPPAGRGPAQLPAAKPARLPPAAWSRLHRARRSLGPFLACVQPVRH